MSMAAQFAIVSLCDYYVQMFMASTGAGMWVYSVDVHRLVMSIVVLLGG